MNTSFGPGVFGFGFFLILGIAGTVVVAVIAVLLIKSLLRRKKLDDLMIEQLTRQQQAQQNQNFSNQQGPQQDNQQAQYVFCTQCGARNVSGSRYCNHCGAPIQKQP
jgi:heme exporter protein D/ribosomal protein L40E